MLSETAPPPIYSQEDPSEESIARNPTNESVAGTSSEPQILIIPATGSIRFQKGYLGADGEQAAIEGELQIKGAEEGHWQKVFVIFSFFD
jgi:hypothetical protein